MKSKGKKKGFFFLKKRILKGTKARCLVSGNKWRMAFRSVINCVPQNYLLFKKILDFQWEEGCFIIFLNVGKYCHQGRWKFLSQI